MGIKDEREILKSGRETLGKFFFDLAKTTFTVMVMGNTIPLFTDIGFRVNTVSCLLTGCVLTFMFAYVGNKIIMNNKKIYKSNVGNNR